MLPDNPDLRRLFAMTVKMFEGDAAAAWEWFHSPNKALGNVSPNALAETETGAREVKDLIGRLEHGVFP